MTCDVWSSLYAAGDVARFPYFLTGESVRIEHWAHAQQVCGLWVVGCGLWVVVCGLWFMVYGLWFMVYGLWFVVSLCTVRTRRGAQRCRQEPEVRDCALFLDDAGLGFGV